MKYEFQKMNLRAALEIIEWDYAPPHNVYNLNGSALALARFVDGPYFSVFSGDELMGFFCYGKAAQLNSKKDNDLYRIAGYLDIGLGLHPAWCNKGKGANFIYAGIDFAKKQGWNYGFRLTVASNNLRAQKVYTRLGFKEKGRIAWDSSSVSDFIVMTLDILEQDPLVFSAD